MQARVEAERGVGEVRKLVRVMLYMHDVKSESKDASENLYCSIAQERYG